MKFLIDFVDPGFLSESIQSVICVPSCLKNLPKTTLPFIPFLFKFWLMNCSVSLKEEVICRINPANSDLFAGLIRQIVSYLPD